MIRDAIAVQPANTPGPIVTAVNDLEKLLIQLSDEQESVLGLSVNNLALKVHPICRPEAPRAECATARDTGGAQEDAKAARSEGYERLQKLIERVYAVTERNRQIAAYVEQLTGDIEL